MKDFYLQAVENRAFVTGLETLQILGVEISTGDSTESNVRSFEAFFINNYTKYVCLIIKLFLLHNKNPLKKRNNEIITQYLNGTTVM
jgi:hypothetical protein